MNRLTYAAILLLLPLIVLGGLIMKNEHDLANSKTWRVKITGYDPRDLLYGHYLRFRFDWENKLNSSGCNIGSDCCLCLNQQAENMVAPPYTYQQCSRAHQQCESTIPLSHADGGFDPTGEQRYLIPEAFAYQLERLLRDRTLPMTLDVKVAPSGQRRFGDLYVNNIEWREYMRQNPNAATPNP